MVDTTAKPVTIGLAATPLPAPATIEATEPAPAVAPVSAASESKPDPYIGLTIDGRYVIDRLLGEGGMGVVYAARHKVIDKRVAIKVLRGDKANDHELNERFLQEARAASAIGNQHIVDISDFGQLPDGSTYFAMEFLDGKSLGGALGEASGPIPVPRICHIAKQIAQGLAAAHTANIVHRDLKPDNVMLIARGRDRDFVKILDFGIAKVGSATTKVTRAGSIFGTPHYMSPEQAAGAVVDHRTDVYALGVILYEMTSGKVPFDADNFMGILTQHMYKAPVPIRVLVPQVNVPPGLEAIVLKCLSKKADARYATMEELVADLEKLEHGTMPDAVNEMMGRSGGFNVPADYFRSTAMPAPVPATPPEVRKRWPLYATIGAVATVVAVAGVALVARSSSSTAQTPSAATQAAPPVVAPPVALPPAASVVAPPPVAPAPVLHEVLVSVTPGDATITRNGADLGPSPLVLHLADGETATLVVTRKGYKPKTAKIDDASGRQSVTLDATPGSAPRPVAPSGGGGGGIDDVGDPFAKKH
ncbi:MAG TPA: serine/threonine-protein kinase [Polyangiaceae bacterium]|jgi:serine/threonine-protein kinase|nr:serine/threonine-protein kinase [Polyangiaceae bacterium]